ncbi:MAG: hypothetical protein NUV63_03780 [Gallionella sp.]|nr:hypothetical protein [Gallionella sp.]
MDETVSSTVAGKPANSQRAVEHVIRNIASLKDVPQLLLNVQWNVATGNVKLFINQETINDYYREQGMAALQPARAAPNCRYY